MTNTAPMLLIDPHKDGRIVDANIAALRFIIIPMKCAQTYTANKYPRPGRHPHYE